MLPVILGTVAVGAILATMDKKMNDSDGIDFVKDKISDGPTKACDGIDWIEEKCGLNGTTISKDGMKELKTYQDLLKEEGVTDPIVDSILNMGNDNKTATTIKKETNKNEFEKLYQLKIDIRNKILEYKFAVMEENEIKKDKTKNVTITDEMRTNLTSYEYILQTTFSKFKSNMDNKTNNDVMRYVDVLKDIYTTKIIKKGKLNPASTDIIIKSMQKPHGVKEPIFVDLSS